MNGEEHTERKSDLYLLGAQLKEIREAARMTLEDVSAATHVRAVILQAIEEGRIDDVNSAPVYLRGFVKTYCSHLDAMDIWDKFSVRLPRAESPSVEESFDANVDLTEPREVHTRPSMLWVYIVLVIAVLAALFLVWRQMSSGEGESGFFLKFNDRGRQEQPAQTEPAKQEPETKPEPEPAPTPEPEPAASPISAEPMSETSADEIAVSFDISPDVTEPAAQPASVDLSWFDGAGTAPEDRPITVVQSEIPDQRLLIEVREPLRLIVRQGGDVLTRRNMTAGGTRSYDVTAPTPVSMSIGSRADVTWYGVRYSPIGSDDGPLALIFYPDGTVTVEEGQSTHFGGQRAAE